MCCINCYSQRLNQGGQNYKTTILAAVQGLGLAFCSFCRDEMKPIPSDQVWILAYNQGLMRERKKWSQKATSTIQSIWLDNVFNLLNISAYI